MKNNTVKFAKIITVGVILAAIVVWLGFSFYTAHKPKEVFIQGQIEATQYSISSKIAGLFKAQRKFMKPQNLWQI